MTTERQLFTARPIGRISVTRNPLMQCSNRAVFYYNLTQHHYDFVVQRDNSGGLNFILDSYHND
jgi:hypothetical protein